MRVTWFRVQSCFTELMSKHSGGRVSSVCILRGNEKGLSGSQKLFSLCVFVCQSVTWWKERTMWRWTERSSRNLLLRSLSALRTTTSTYTTPPLLVVAANDSSERSLLYLSWLISVCKKYVAKQEETGDQLQKNKTKTYVLQHPENVPLTPVYRPLLPNHYINI